MKLSKGQWVKAKTGGGVLIREGNNYKVVSVDFASDRIHVYLEQDVIYCFDGALFNHYFFWPKHDLTMNKNVKVL